jgi:hypothetical protein
VAISPDEIKSLANQPPKIKFGQQFVSRFDVKMFLQGANLDFLFDNKNVSKLNVNQNLHKNELL